MTRRPTSFARRWRSTRRSPPRTTGSAGSSGGSTNIAAAAREFDRAIELDDTNVEAYLNRAGLSRALGDFRQSIADCQRGLAARPAQPIAGG